MATKRDSWWVKSWHERTFEESSFKFRRLNDFWVPCVLPQLSALAPGVVAEPRHEPGHEPAAAQHRPAHAEPDRADGETPAAMELDG